MSLAEHWFHASTVQDLVRLERGGSHADLPEEIPLEFIFHNRASQTLFKLQQGLKRWTDIALAAVGLMILSPLLALTALLVKFSSPGPVLYKSLRIGQDCREFYMYKFRTMSADADSHRDKLREESNLQGELFKLANDPRVTPMGQFLRAFSLDEFPQLLNVLRGEMSLVGPRPLPPDESELFEAPYTLRFKVPPGITGLWQISGRSSLNFQQLCQLEMRYLLNWSFFSDLHILLKTVPAVLIRKGAF